MDMRQTILIVDDRKENLFALRKVLADLDVEVISATNGNEALTAALYHDFALAILDVLMPDMDGYELAGLLRGDPRTRALPIVFITAVYGQQEHVFRGYDSGAVDYLVKPYEPRVLLSKAKVFLELHRARAQLRIQLHALALSEERFRSLVMTVPDIVFRINRQGEFTFLNDSVQRLGYRAEELLGVHFSAILAPGDAVGVGRDFVLPHYAGKATGAAGAPRLFDERRTGARMTSGLEVRLLSRGGTQAFPALVLCVDEEYVAGEVSSSGLYSGGFDGEEAPEFLGTVGVIRDITERKRAEQELLRHRDHLEELVQERTTELGERTLELRMAAQQWQATFDAMREGVVLLDADLRILRCNKSQASLIGKPVAEILGRFCCDALHLWMQYPGECLAERTRRSLLHESQQLCLQDRWYECATDPVLDDAGRLTGMVHIVTDITDVTERRRAEAANLAKSQFLAVMSHEIRTPMNGILGMAQLLMLDPINQDERQRYVQAILNSGQSLLGLLDDLLDLSKIEAGKVDLDLVPCAPADLINQVAALFNPAAQRKGVQLEAHWHGPSHGYLADAQRLQQMLSNLVSNAIKFTHHGTISIDAMIMPPADPPSVAGLQELRFMVTDTGVGIPQEKLGLLFQPFTQADRSVARQYAGTGLGLSIVRRLAELMGGEVGVTSTPREGSTFWFSIRAAEAAPVPHLPNRSRRQPLALAPDTLVHFLGHVLIVEDSETTRQVLESLLLRLGISFLSLETGHDAVDWVTQATPLIKDSSFDLILMDCQMPVMDGFEAALRIRQWEHSTRRPAVPIVAMSADLFDDNRNHCRQVGMDDFLAKPLRFDELIDVLRKWLKVDDQAPSAQVVESLASGRVPIDSQRIVPLLRELGELLADHRFGALRVGKELGTLLRDTSLADDMTRITECLEQFDFAAALGAVDQLIKHEALVQA